MSNVFDMINTSIEIDYANESVAIDALKTMSELKKEVNIINKRYKNVNLSDEDEIDELMSDIASIKTKLYNIAEYFSNDKPSYGDKIISFVYNNLPVIIVVLLSRLHVAVVNTNIRAGRVTTMEADAHRMIQNQFGTMIIGMGIGIGSYEASKNSAVRAKEGKHFKPTIGTVTTLKHYIYKVIDQLDVTTKRLENIKKDL